MAVISLLLLTLLGPLLLFLSAISALARNYSKAQTIGIPILIVPVSYSNPLWLVIGRHAAPWFRHLPFGLGNTVSRIGYSGWEWAQKHSMFPEYGPGFVIVTPVQNWLYTFDGEKLYGIFYGERQGSIERPTELAGFGRSCAVAGSEDEDQDDSGPTKDGDGLVGYHTSLRLILENILVVFLLGAKVLGRIEWPANLARIGKGFRSFQIHMKNDFETAKDGLREKGTTEGTLMANLVRAFVESEESNGFGILEQEVFGNMFAYQFSGHDTTARSLNFTFYLLAAFPEVQDWMREEIQHVLGEKSTLR
ncbi:hypothetical protein INS49_004794 [Diaporthe citri]|uniref:uncharacterized protein n=1 Tax=Diaporthe citri TaxID=83186 RepID=UPI001C81A09A|nr:uncharacterized protein INS49_004794 [Diaporthe citri]KAG6354190.1 hypothetical protein INS49_004794 [Diaporthe citri]